jgi:DNA repair protein SbcD/Mre11
MRLLHTGDWHLGKRLYGTDRLDEAARALDEVAGLAEAEAVDATIVAGDLLDRRVLDPAAFGVCLRALGRLAAAAPVLAVAGNHDDPELWIHLAPHLERSGIRVAGRVRGAAEAVVTVATAAGPLHAALLPWPEPARMALDSGSSVRDARGRYAERVAGIIDAYAAEARARRAAQGGAAVLVGHLMVDRALAGGGERELTMGMTYVVSPAALPADLDYVALGHVHRPQTIPGLAAAGRYAGSPIALDFSEDNHAKSAVIAEIGDTTTTSREVPLTAGRPLVRIRGPLGDLAARASAHPDAWLACEVELDGPVLDLVRRVREVVPRALRVEPRYPDAAPAETPPASADAGGGGGAALGDLYAEWYRLSGRRLAPAQAAAFAAAVAAGRGEDEAADDAEPS